MTTAPTLARDHGLAAVRIYCAHGAPQVKPCAEAVLTDRAAERMRPREVMPRLSIHRQRTVRLARFKYLTDPPLRTDG